MVHIFVRVCYVYVALCQHKGLLSSSLLRSLAEGCGDSLNLNAQVFHVCNNIAATVAILV